MKLIADSGSTKTDWALLSPDRSVMIFTTSGINPYFMDGEEIARIIKDEFPGEVLQASVDEIFFYGAGCSSEMLCQRVRDGLKKIYPEAAITVEHDLLGAARALCGRKPGIAAILGTGSNSCLYDGENIIDTHGGIGFILGDEGSGADMGKRLIRAWLYKSLPEEVNEAFRQKYGYTRDDIVEKVYRQPNPNRFLASFAPFLEEHIHDKTIESIVNQSLEDFITTHICYYKEHRELPVHFVGSIAFYFSVYLQKICKKHNIQSGVITTRPIRQLIDFHRT